MVTSLHRKNPWHHGNRSQCGLGFGIWKPHPYPCDPWQWYHGFTHTNDIPYLWCHLWMWKDPEEGYIPSCVNCARNKSSTTKPTGPLYPLPIPDERCQSISMDFISLLPVDQGHDCILTITDRLGLTIHIIPTSSTSLLRNLQLYSSPNGIVKMVFHLTLSLVGINSLCHHSGNISLSWQVLNARHPLASTPQSNGVSKQKNKTVNQCIRFHVERNQKGWVHALGSISWAQLISQLATLCSTFVSGVHPIFCLPYLTLLLIPPSITSLPDKSSKISIPTLLTLVTTSSLPKSLNHTFQTPNILTHPFSKWVTRSCWIPYIDARNINLGHKIAQQNSCHVLTALISLLILIWRPQQLPWTCLTLPIYSLLSTHQTSSLGILMMTPNTLLIHSNNPVLLMLMKLKNSLLSPSYITKKLAVCYDFKWL